MDDPTEEAVKESGGYSRGWPSKRQKMMERILEKRLTWRLYRLYYVQ